MIYYFEHAFIIGPNMRNGEFVTCTPARLLNDNELDLLGVDVASLGGWFKFLQLNLAHENATFYAVLGQQQLEEYYLKTMTNVDPIDRLSINRKYTKLEDKNIEVFIKELSCLRSV